MGGKLVVTKAARVCRKAAPPARKASQADEVEEGGAASVAKRAPRPSGCHRFVRREIADAMPAICAMLLTQVLKGNLPALKILLEMAAVPAGSERRTSGQTGFARKVLAGFKEWEARETEARRKS